MTTKRGAEAAQDSNESTSLSWSLSKALSGGSRFSWLSRSLVSAPVLTLSRVKQTQRYYCCEGGAPAVQIERPPVACFVVFFCKQV